MNDQPNELGAVVRDLIREAVPDTIEIRHGSVRQDPLITLERSGHSPLTLRLQGDGLLISIGDSDAFEFDVTETDDIERLISAFCAGELQAEIGIRDGRIYGLRASGVDYALPTGFLAALRSGGRRRRLL